MEGTLGSAPLKALPDPTPHQKSGREASVSGPGLPWPVSFPACQHMLILSTYMSLCHSGTEDTPVLSHGAVGDTRHIRSSSGWWEMPGGLVSELRITAGASPCGPEGIACRPVCLIARFALK